MTNDQVQMELKRRILVVDDNVDAAQSMSMLLEMSGHAVAYAYDGASALKVALDFAPEVVLLDIGLPGMDGFEVARRMRADPHTAGCTLIALTGYGRSEDRQRSASSGFNHHLVKPVDPNALEALLVALPATEKSARA
jgi:CheY-like chemotaxis protein